MSKLTLPLAAAGGVLFLSGAAFAADNPAGDKAEMMEKAYGSTVVSTYPDGRQGELWIARDGTYTAEGRRFNRSSGTWQVKGDRLCLKQKAPFPAPFSFCTSLPPEGFAGSSWAAKSPTGDPVKVKLVRGMHGRDATPRRSTEAGAETGKG